MNPTPRTFHIESLGCAKNQVDAEVMIAALERAGWTLAGAPEDAEVLIVNTCGFIDAARRESIETGFALRARFPGRRLFLVGCLTERYAGELAAEMPEIDGFIGNRDPSRIVDLVEGRVPRGPAPAGEPPRPAPRRARLLSYPGSAYLKVAEGCANRCSYCAIPLIRGDLASRPRADVVDEARGLLDSGVHELVLIAQDLGSYGLDRGAAELPALLADLSALPGGFWVRLLYVHPDHFPAGVLPIMRDDPRFLPYLDVPFQHASPAILAAMGRKADPEANLRLVERIRAALPGAVLRSTFLVGFPGETDRDAELLARFQEEAALDWVGVFTYSREEGTRGARPARARDAPRRRRAPRGGRGAAGADHLAAARPAPRRGARRAGRGAGGGGGALARQGVPAGARRGRPHGRARGLRAGQPGAGPHRPAQRLRPRGEPRRGGRRAGRGPAVPA